jgi:RNA polymerase sigma-70 factor (ECF subfamily)
MNIDQFQKMVQRIRPQVLQMAKRQLNNNEDAEDITQEVFLRLWLARERLDDYDNVEHVAIRTLRNICIDRYRKKKLDCEELSDNQISALEENPHQRLESQENVQQLIQIINELPHLQQLIVKLKDIDGYEIEEITKITQTSAESVRMNLSRARKKIRELFINQKDK